MIGVDGASGNPAIDDGFNLTNGFERLAFDRRRRQPADMRSRYDIRELRQLRRRHLISGAAYIHRRPGNAVLSQRSDQGCLVDQIATGQIDEERVRLHVRQRCLPDQIFGTFVGDCQTDNVIGVAEEVFEQQMLYACVVNGCKWIGYQNLHAQCFCYPRKVLADAAITK